MDTSSFVIYIKMDDIHRHIAEDVETRFHTSNYELDRPLPKGKNKKVIGVLKGELGAKIMKEFVSIESKHSYLIEEGSEDKKQKAQKSVS